MSIPISAMASTATGFIASAGAEPEERTSTCPLDRAVRKPAAIWERPALWTQTNMTVGRSDMGSPSVDGAIRCGQVRRRCEGLAELLGGGLCHAQPVRDTAVSKIGRASCREGG